MADNIERYQQRIKAFLRDLAEDRPEDTLLIGKELLTLIRLRVQNKGEKATGGKFGNYSRAVVPNWYFDGRANSKGAEKRLKKKGYFVSYTDFRQANNLQTSFVDLTFSGKMWKETGAKVRANDLTRSLVVLDGTTARSNRLIDFNSERYGNILRPSPKEIDMVNRANFERVLNKLKRALKR